MFEKLSFLLSAFLAVSFVAARTDKEKLVASLLTGYIREVDPGNTPLKMALSYVCADLNTETSQLTSKLLEKYEWIDSRLKWTPSEHSGIEQIRLPAKLLWTPDVKLYNTQFEAEVRDDVNTIVYANGSVLWIPMVTYKTQCKPVHDDESQDVATCQIKIGSWTYDANNLDLQLSDSGFDTGMYTDTCPFEIHDAVAKVESMIYPCCPDPYASLDVNFSLRPRV